MVSLNTLKVWVGVLIKCRSVFDVGLPIREHAKRCGEERLDKVREHAEPLLCKFDSGLHFRACPLTPYSSAIVKKSEK